MRYVVALTALLLFAGSALAQTDSRGSSERRTTIKFDQDDVITGDSDQPDLHVIEVIRGARFQTLIRTRDNFHNQVVTSVAKL